MNAVQPVTTDHNRANAGIERANLGQSAQLPVRKSLRGSAYTLAEE